MIGPQQLQRVRKVDHFRNRWRLFEGIIPEGKCDTRHLAMELIGGFRSAAGDDLRFSLRLRMLNAHIQAATANGIAETAFLITGENDERNAPGFNRSEF